MDAATLGAAIAIAKKFGGEGGGGGSGPVANDYELIIEDTYTNDELAHHVINVDSDGNSFELTDAILLIETPKQETSSQKGSDGQVQYYYGTGTDDYSYWNIGTWTQAANSAAHGAICMIEQKDGLVHITCSQNATSVGFGNMRYRYREGFGRNAGPVFPVGNGFTLNKFDIRGTLGTVHFILYGKKKKS